MELFAGIEIGGTKLQLVTGDGTGKILERRRLAVEVEKGAQGIRKQIETALSQMLGGRKAQAVGVGFGGPVDWKTGKICRSHQIEGWAEFDLAAWLQPLVTAPAYVDNDANVAALGEARCGAGVGFNPVFYVTLGSGVGGGLVVSGNIYHGSSPGEAEIGHVRLDQNGTTVESRCSGWAVDARVRELAKAEPTSALAQKLTGNAGGEAKYLVAALEEGDSLAKKILEATAEDLAFGLSHVVHLFHPAIIVIGGGLSGVGESFRFAVQNALRRFVMQAFLPGPIIKLSKLGEDAVPVGALELARERRSENRAEREPGRLALRSLTENCPDIRHPNLYALWQMKQWIADYIRVQKAAHDSISIDGVAQLIEKLRDALQQDRQIFVFGNGGSAANSSHFATDLGKGASDKVGKRFRVFSLNDNVSWMTAIGNDYAYEDIFVRQLENYGKPGDIALGISVSGNSPNCVKALDWAKKNGLRTVALVGGKRGRMGEIAEQSIVINDTHYGRVEDAQMGICHLICYAFMEHPEWGKV